jgi:ATP-dependent exoDNAse (exonuclease V) beta subunit
MNPIINKNISLIQDTHKYVLETKPDLNFTSVTTVIGSFFEPFEEQKIAKYLCSTNPKYKRMTPEELISEWHYSREQGTKIHEEIECFIKDDKPPVSTKAFSGINWLKQYYTNFDVDIFTEAIIFSTKLKIAGTVDILVYDKKANVYDIIDWKTGKRINKYSFQGKKGNHQVTSDLMDCNFIHYALQMSLYRYILEAYYKVKIRNQMICHLQKTTCKCYDTPYYFDHIKEMLSELN